MSASSQTSVYDLIKQPLNVIREILKKFSAELRTTIWPDVYLIKCHSETKINEPVINPLRGLIFNHRTGQVYSLTFPVPIEVKDLPIEERKSLITQIMKNPYTIQEALDGTLLRLSYFEEVQSWILSTNGKEDANKAYWMNGQSFYQQFWSVKPAIDLDHLDRNNVYLFTLCHPLNVIVINHPKPQLYHVATYNKKTCKEITYDLPIKQPRIFSSMTLDDVQKQITESQDKPVLSAGYMVVQMGNDGLVHRYRFENQNYTEARNLRGNSNNIEYRLLELMLNGHQGGPNSDSSTTQNLETFLQYYPIYRPTVEHLIQRIELLAQLLTQQYGLRYKQRRNIWVHSRHHRFLSEIHTQVYLAKLRDLKQTVKSSDILQFIKIQPTAYVLYLINYIYDVSNEGHEFR